MKTFKTIEAHVEERRVIDVLTCDCCGEECPHPADANWNKEGRGLERGSLSTTWLCDGDVDIIEMDICTKCAEWLMKEIEAQRIRRPLG